MRRLAPLRTNAARLAGLALLVTGCTPGGKPPGTVTTKQSVGTGGGSIVLDNGVNLTIPAGALPADVELGVTWKPETTGVTAALPEGVEGAPAGVLELTPHGTQFAEPVEVTMPSTLVDDDFVLLRLADDSSSEWTVVGPARREGDTIQFKVLEFSIYSPVVVQKGTCPCWTSAVMDEFDQKATAGTRYVGSTKNFGSNVSNKGSSLPRLAVTAQYVSTYRNFVLISTSVAYQCGRQGIEGGQDLYSITANQAAACTNLLRSRYVNGSRTNLNLGVWAQGLTGTQTVSVNLAINRPDGSTRQSRFSMTAKGDLVWDTEFYPSGTTITASIVSTGGTTCALDAATKTLGTENFVFLVNCGVGVEPGCKTNPTICDDRNACTRDECSTQNCAPGAATCTGCTNTPLTGASCEDGDLCTQDDLCTEGVCRPGLPTVCLAQDGCHEAGTCDTLTGLCSDPVKPDGATCDDRNLCTQDDTCGAGVCRPGMPVVCSPRNQCHDEGVCDPWTGLCSDVAKQDGSSCDDQNRCTELDTCHAGVCNSGEPVTCAASDQCHDAGVCDPDTGSCSDPAKSDRSPCDDRNLCTQGDACETGVCLAGTPVTCSASDQCHDAGVCEPSTGTCSNPAKPDRSPCDDRDLCTRDDLCDAGRCRAGTPVTCSASDQCHDAGVCEPSTGTCSNPPKGNGTTCNDSDQCTTGDECQSGTCAGRYAPGLGGNCDCGNRSIDDGEQCDDGNGQGGDGCSSSCQSEANHSCLWPGTACHRWVCGNGLRDPGEACDDGNQTDGDRCSNDCLVARCAPVTTVAGQEDFGIHPTTDEVVTVATGAEVSCRSEDYDQDGVADQCTAISLAGQHATVNFVAGAVTGDVSWSGDSHVFNICGGSFTPGPAGGAEGSGTALFNFFGTLRADRPVGVDLTGTTRITGRLADGSPFSYQIVATGTYRVNLGSGVDADNNGVPDGCECP
jgi:cysteine-rich repeat protein